MTDKQMKKLKEIMEEENKILETIEYEGEVEFEDVTYKEAIVTGMKKGVVINKFATMISKTGKAYYLEYEEDNEDISRPDNVVEVLI